MMRFSISSPTPRRTWMGQARSIFLTRCGAVLKFCCNRRGVLGLQELPSPTRHFDCGAAHRNRRFLRGLKFRAAPHLSGNRCGAAWGCSVEKSHKNCQKLSPLCRRKSGLRDEKAREIDAHSDSSLPLISRIRELSRGIFKIF